MIRKLKTKFLIVLLGVYLAGALSIFPAASNLTSSTSLDLPVKQASAQSITCPNLIDYSSINLTTKIAPAFIKITKDGKTLDGQQVRLNATVTLNSHDKIGFDTGYRWPPSTVTSVWFGDPYCIDSPGLNDWIEELRLVGVNEKNKETACRFSAFYQCNAQYESPSDYFEERYMNRGEPVPWNLELSASNLAAMNVLSSPEGTVNRIIILPRFYTSLDLSTRPVLDADFPDAGAILTLQVFDTLDQLKASGSTVPPGVETETEATGGNSDSNKLKTCFTASDDSVFCLLNLFLGAIGSLLEQFIKVTWSRIVAPVLSTSLSIRTYEDKFANVIYPAWIILRNLTNIAFILAIIAMGIATVFRISGWMVRDLMIKLIIGAFLVNFSLVIPQAILGIAETVQNQFLSADSGAINAISNQLLSFHLFDSNPNANFGSFSETIRIFMNFWVMLFGFIAFCAVLFIVVVRLIVIWVLLMTSPLIYAAYIFPATRSFFNKWWSTFMKWAFITAAVGFMLNLTAIVTFQSRGLLVGLSGVDTTTLGGDTGIAYEFMTQLIPIIFLYATVKVATSMGSGINSFVDKTLAKGAAFGTGAAAGMLTYGALAPAKFVGKTAAKPFVTIGKNVGQWGKDKAQMKYLDTINKIKPKEGDEQTKMGRRWAAVKGGVFNVLSGNALTAERQAERKGKIESMKTQTKGIAKDYRLVRKELKPQIAKQLADQEYRKDVKERLDLITSDTKEETEQMIEKLLSKDSLDYSEQMSLQAGLIKASQTDKSFGSLLDRRFGGDIHALMSKIYDSANGGEDGHRAMVQFSNEMNSYAIPKGKLQLVTDNNDPRSAALAGRKIENILSNATGNEVAQMDSDVFLQGGTLPLPNSSTGRTFSKFILSFREPNMAAANLSVMSDKKREAYRNLNLADLEHFIQITNPGMVHADVVAAANNFISQMS